MVPGTYAFVFVPGVSVKLRVEDTIGSWGDIISSLDIYLSPQAQGYAESNMRYIYKAGCQYDRDDSNRYHDNAKNGARSLLGVEYTAEADFGTASQVSYPFNFDERWPVYDGVSYRAILIPERADALHPDEIIADESRFYLYKSVSKDSLPATIDIAPTTAEFRSLASREIMTDSQRNRAVFKATDGYDYNSRLHLAMESITYAQPEVMSQLMYNTTDHGVSGIYLVLNVDGTEYVVATDYQSSNCPNSNGMEYLFFDNPYATNVIVDFGLVYRKIPLKRHPMLNGMYFFSFHGITVSGETVNAPTVVGMPEVDASSKVFQSEINNPFFFPLKATASTGTARITKLCAAVKAMSQGQFGVFPLYAFTSDGVYAMQLNSDGTLANSHPVTRDVCINDDSVTSIDSDVLFATERGIMMLSGSTAKCISEQIFTHDPFDLTTLPHLSDAFGNAVLNTYNLSEFLQFIAGCAMIYDYIHQRVVVYNPSSSYAYVWSIKSKEWGMKGSSIVMHVNSYPDALAVHEEGGTVKKYVYDEGGNTVPEGAVQYLVTRPIKLDYPNALKTVDTVIQRGYFRIYGVPGSLIATADKHVKSILYGSRDLFNWFPVSSSEDHYLRGFRGTPYKYFRIALILKLKGDESVYGCTVQYTPRYMNKPR